MASPRTSTSRCCKCSSYCLRVLTRCRLIRCEYEWRRASDGGQQRCRMRYSLVIAFLQTSLSRLLASAAIPLVSLSRRKPVSPRPSGPGALLLVDSDPSVTFVHASCTALALHGLDCAHSA